MQRKIVRIVIVVLKRNTNNTQSEQAINKSGDTSLSGDVLTSGENDGINTNVESGE